MLESITYQTQLNRFVGGQLGICFLQLVHLICMDLYDRCADTHNIMTVRKTYSQHYVKPIACTV